jgi:hypothetical protein
MSETTRKYWVLATHWDETVWQESIDLWEVIAIKAEEMMLAGNLVLGTLGTREHPTGIPGHVNWLPDWRRSWKKNAQPPSINDVANPEHTFSKSLRIFISEAAANEYSSFVLSHGALASYLLTEEEVEAICPLPADQYIDAMIVNPADSARIATLLTQKVTTEQMQAALSAFKTGS